MKVVCTLLVFILATAHTACLAKPVREGVGPYKAADLTSETRESLERLKRDFIQIEDLVIGNAALASWSGRIIRADLEVRYIDEILAYQGPIVAYMGFYVAPRSDESNRISSAQPGVMLGLNGMAIGGKRRFIIDSELVCSPRKSSCAFVGPDEKGHGTGVRKETLIVEATLTEACIPQLRVYRYGTLGTKTEVVGCRRPDYPKRDPALPIWHLY